MRETYAQIIAYNRAYADTVTSYTAADNTLIQVANSAGETATRICDAISGSSAAAIAPTVAAAPPPTTVTPVADLANPHRFLTGANPVCTEWITLNEQLALRQQAALHP